MNAQEKTQIESANVRPVGAPAGLENAMGAVRAIVDVFRTVYPQSQYETEYAEDAVIVTIITKGFDHFMNSEIQRIARTYNVKIGFNVEPLSENYINVFLVVGEVDSE